MQNSLYRENSTFGYRFLQGGLPADLLNQPDNMIPRQLDNRQRAIEFISSNRSSLESEFGKGDAAQPAGQVARALAAYEQTMTIAA